MPQHWYMQACHTLCCASCSILEFQGQVPCALWAQRPQLVKMAKGLDATVVRLTAAMVKHKLSRLQIQAITGRSPDSNAKHKHAT